MKVKINFKILFPKLLMDYYNKIFCHKLIHRNYQLSVSQNKLKNEFMKRFHFKINPKHISI